jgi:hypothetical protein
MPQTAHLGNTFSIHITNDEATTFTVAQPNDFSNYKIIRVSVYNTGGTPNFTMTDGTSDICATQATVAAGWKDMVITSANAIITSAENLVITTAATTTTQIVIDCIGAGALNNNTGMITWLSTVAKELSVA